MLLREPLAVGRWLLALFLAGVAAFVAPPALADDAPDDDEPVLSRAAGVLVDVPLSLTVAPTAGHSNLALVPGLGVRLGQQLPLGGGHLVGYDLGLLLEGGVDGPAALQVYPFAAALQARGLVGRAFDVGFVRVAPYLFAGLEARLDLPVRKAGDDLAWLVAPDAGLSAGAGLHAQVKPLFLRWESSGGRRIQYSYWMLTMSAGWAF